MRLRSPYGALLVLDANGTPVPGNTSNINQQITYTGQRLDPETSNYYFKNRYYDPAQGKFISRDPLGYVDGMNLYAGYFAMRFMMDMLGLDDDEKLFDFTWSSTVRNDKKEAVDEMVAEGRNSSPMSQELWRQMTKLQSDEPMAVFLGIDDDGPAYRHKQSGYATKMLVRMEEKEGSRFTRSIVLFHESIHMFFDLGSMERRRKWAPLRGIKFTDSEDEKVKGIETASELVAMYATNLYRSEIGVDSRRIMHKTEFDESQFVDEDEYDSDYFRSIANENLTESHRDLVLEAMSEIDEIHQAGKRNVRVPAESSRSQK